MKKAKIEHLLCFKSSDILLPSAITKHNKMFELESEYIRMGVPNKKQYFDQNLLTFLIVNSKRIISHLDGLYMKSIAITRFVIHM